MYKKDFIKRIIPDIIITIGIILFIIGIFNLIESDYPEADQVTVFEKQNGSILEEEKELAFIEKLEERDKDFAIENGRPGQLSIELDEEMLMRLADRPTMIGDYLSYSKDVLKLNNEISKENQGKGDQKETISFTIPEGSSGRDVAKILDEKNLVNFDDFIELLLLFDIEKRIKAGRYNFDNQSSFSDILSRILIK